MTLFNPNAAVTTSATYKVLLRMFDAEQTTVHFPEKVGKWTLKEIKNPHIAVYVDKHGTPEDVIIDASTVERFYKAIEGDDSHWLFETSHNVPPSIADTSGWGKSTGGDDTSWLHENCSGYYD